LPLTRTHITVALIDAGLPESDALSYLDGLKRDHNGPAKIANLVAEVLQRRVFALKASIAEQTDEMALLCDVLNIFEPWALAQSIIAEAKS